MTETQHPKDNLVALSRFRAQLSRGQRARRADLLFDAEDPAAAISALPPDEFFYVLHELGFPEALDVLFHGTAEQVQTALDFSLWDKDTLVPEKVSEWLGALLEAPIETLGAWVKDLDVELLALLIRQRARIYDLTQEEAPDEPEGVLWNAPDGNFTLEFLGEPNEARSTQQFVDTLFRFSPSTARRLLVGARSELDAELEEMALRWRKGRMEDLGFFDYYEALEIYRELDPASIRLEEKPGNRIRPLGENTTGDALRLPRVMAERLSQKTPFARAVATLSAPDRLAEAHFALVALCNRALSADRVAPGDDEAVRKVLERVATTLDLGVEFLARNDEDREALAIRSQPLVTLFRLGHSLTLKLRRLALALVKKTPFAVHYPALTIFEREDQEILASFSRLRPQFPRCLENPPATGERPFATLADIALGTQALAEAGQVVEILLGLGFRPEHLSPERLSSLDPPVDPTTVDAGVLLRTLCVRHLLGLVEHPIRPLSKDQLEKFKHAFMNGSELNDIAQSKVEARLLAALAGKRPEMKGGKPYLRWLSSFSPLGPVLGREKV